MSVKYIIVIAFVAECFIASLQCNGNMDCFFVPTNMNSDTIPMLNRKIFGDYRVTINEHPYMVSVRRFYSHYLTGSLLTKNLVITVAHPLFKVNPSELGVVVGENYSDRGTSLLTVVIVLIHQDFDSYTLNADLALIRLYEDIIYKLSVKPMTLISPFTKLDGAVAFVTGWGRCDRTGKELCLPRSSKYFRGERMDPMLRTIKFTLHTHSNSCQAYNAFNLVERRMLCLGSARVDEPYCPCMAVPGAPLVVNSRLVGIQSWGFGCGYTKDLPLVYTNLLKYHSWILHNVPIFKQISRLNLTLLFQATKIYTLTEGLFQTRISVPTLKQFPSREIQMLYVDSVLSKVRGTVYDVRDFMKKGLYHASKLQLYDSLQKMRLKAEAIETIGSKRMMDTEPFLSNNTIGESGLMVRNGTLYEEDDFKKSSKGYDKEAVHLNQTESDRAEESES